MTEQPRPHAHAQLARYDGPKTSADLRSYALLLAGADNPRGLANSALPSAFRGNPAALAFAVEYARALDVAPVTAITGIHIIDGKPTASAGLISALIRRAGHRLRVWVEGSLEDLTLTGIATLTRVDDPDHEYRTTFDLKDAERGELLEFRDGTIYARTERGRRTQWEKYPRAMVKARALTEVAREAAEDALLGVHYTPEELGAEVDESGEPVYTVTQAAPGASAQEATSAAQTPQNGSPAQAPAEPASSGQQPPPAPTKPVEEIVASVLTAVDLEFLRRVWRYVNDRNIVDADVSKHLDVADIDLLTSGEGLPEHPELGWLISATRRYVDYHDKPIRLNQTTGEVGATADQQTTEQPAEESSASS